MPSHSVRHPGPEPPEPQVIEYRVIREFVARYYGWCAIVPEHRIERGDFIGWAVEPDNPKVSLGMACKECVAR